MRCSRLWLAPLLLLAVLPFQAQLSPDSKRAAQAVLERIPHGDLGNGYFRNPVMVGPGSDNTVVRVGKDFYMMGGGGWPDQLVWHSGDLVNWRPITRALRKFDGGAWASDITYYKGKYYIYTTQVDTNRGNVGALNSSQRSLLGVAAKDQGDKAWKNVALWADNPAGPWSDPIDIGVFGVFDPGHVVDQQGNRYLFFNKGMMIRLAPDGLSVAGELKKVYDGWDYPKDWVVECKCLEAPKLIFRNGYYYMSSAEGGTAGPTTAHMGIMARSHSLEGPWENSPYNPVLHTQNQAERWWRQGHGTLIDDADGNWWIFYTGYENGFTLFGKQTLLLPIEWTADGWPRVPTNATTSSMFKKPSGENVGHGMPLSDDFSGTTLGVQWQYGQRINPASVFELGGGRLTIDAAGAIPGQAAILPADAQTLSVMPVNHSFEAEVEVTIPDTAEGGIMLASGGRGGNTWATAGLRKGQAFATWAGQANYLNWTGGHMFIRIRNLNYDVSAFHSVDGKTWIPFENSTYVTDGRRLSLYAAGAGKVTFRNFKYRGID